MVSNVASSVSSSASSSTHVVIPCSDFNAAVWLPLDVLIPAKRIDEPLYRFSTSFCWTSNSSGLPIRFILSINSGMIDRSAEVMVYRVNSTRCPRSKVSKVKIVFTANDLPLPRPPVMMKYRTSSGASTMLW